MQELGPATEAMSVQDIIQTWGESGGALDRMISSTREPNHDFERLIQINRAKYNWHFVRGNQFIAPDFVPTVWGEIVDYVSVDSPPSYDETGADVKFCYPLNVLGGDLYKFMAVMGQSAPRVKAVPDDAEDAENVEQSKSADVNLTDLWVKWKADQLQRVLAFHQYTTGPVFGHTPWVVDKLKYGSTMEPKVGMATEPDGSPVPTQQGVEEYPNGDAELHLYNVLEVTVPFGAKKLDECGFLHLEYMESKWKLLQAFGGTPDEPGPLDKYRTTEPPDDDMNSDAVAAAEARESVANPSLQGRPRRPNQWRYRQIWFRPWFYQAIEDVTLRQTMQRQFPNGCKLVKVGSLTMDIVDEQMDDVWGICKTGRDDKILANPLCHDKVPFQRMLNDFGNLAVETTLRAIPQTIVEQTLLDREAMSKKEALPAEIIFTARPAAMEDLSKGIAQIPGARMSDQLVPLFNLFRALDQDISGIRPELAGGGQPTQTFREAKQRKDQGLMQLSPQAQEMQFFWQTVGRNGVRQRAKYGSGTVKAHKKSAFGIETSTSDLSTLSRDGWHVEADDNFPMTTADRFDRLWGILKEFPPDVQQQLGVLDPMNLEQTLLLLQIPDYQSPLEDQKKKTLGDIYQLLQGQAVEPTPDPTARPGAPPPPKQPSIPVDAYDNHQFVADFTQKWMVSPAGQKEKGQRPAGFENVQVFQQAHAQMATPPSPPPPPPVKAGLTTSAKFELLPPDVQNEILQGSGLPGLGQMPPQGPPGAPPLTPGGPQQPPQGALEAGPDQLESPAPPLPEDIPPPPHIGPPGPMIQ